MLKIRIIRLFSLIIFTLICPLMVKAGPSAIAFDGTYIWIADPDNGNLYALNPSNGSIVSTVGIGTSANITQIVYRVVNSRRLLFMIRESLNQLQVYDISNPFSVGVSNYQVASDPRGIALGSALNCVYIQTKHIWVGGPTLWIVSGNGNALTKFGGFCTGAAGGGVAATYTFDAPTSVAWDGTYVWVSGAGPSGAYVDTVDGNTGAVVNSLGTGASFNFLFFDGSGVWAAAGGPTLITKLNQSLQVVCSANGGVNAGDMTSDGANVWVVDTYSPAGHSYVTKVSQSTCQTIGSYQTGFVSSGVTFDGTNIWVTNHDSYNVMELLASTGSVEGTFNVP